MTEKKKKLQLFLEENNLYIISTLASTDLFCSYAVVDCDKYSYFEPLQEGEFYVSFMYEAFKGSMFSWELTDRPCMCEDEFIEELNKIKLSGDVYRPSGSIKDK